MNLALERKYMKDVIKMTLVWMILFFAVPPMTLALYFKSLEEEIVLHQSEEEIIQIDLVYAPNDQFDILYTLKREEYADFLNELTDLKLQKSTQPWETYGVLVVQLGYSDGSREILGATAVAYCTDDSEEMNGWYSLDISEMYSLFSGYVDLSHLPYLERARG